MTDVVSDCEGDNHPKSVSTPLAPGYYSLIKAKNVTVIAVSKY
jgi:hypothetical protein